ncbi:hypothetical protein [Microbulbifer sp. SSSA005]|uniref:hypothetical protein n=1 Tax=Microbulbifer sp. SSSA005 TaxID=3243378 RepID=UPI0040395C9D
MAITAAAVTDHLGKNISMATFLGERQVSNIDFFSDVVRGKYGEWKYYSHGKLGHFTKSLPSSADNLLFYLQDGLGVSLWAQVKFFRSGYTTWAVEVGGKVYASRAGKLFDISEAEAELILSSEISE